MLSRIFITAVLLVHAAYATVVLAQSRSIEGIYRNSALGYSVRVPSGLKGVGGDETGPERGVRISLPSGGRIDVFGEPNSLEFKTPEEGIAAGLALKDCVSGERKVESAFVGKLKGAKGRLVCGDRVLMLFLVFRTRGGPIYWLRLKTGRPHESEDEAILKTIAGSFRLIRWK